MARTVGFCGKCGRGRASPNDRFCQGCGAPFVELATTSAPSYCRQCGASWGSPTDQNCSSCGTRLEGMPSEDPRTPSAALPLTAPMEPRSLLLIVVLSVVTVSIYFVVWLGLTWSEMKRELRDDTMHPVWHALTIFVPIYGWFRIHEHFVTINFLLDRTGGASRVNPGAVVGALVVLAVVGNIANLVSPGATIVIWVVTVVVNIVIATHGQSGLNECWRARAQAR